jgi:thiol:disulfide interchange protein DsbA
MAWFAMLSLTLALSAQAARSWVEGTDYVLLTPVQRTTVPPGKIEVMEVFSYGCIVCNGFQPTIEKLKASLPSNAQLVFLPASFNPSEDWPMFQRAYFAAQQLGIAERTHQAMFDAVWNTGELAISDPASRRLKSPQPSIEDAARYYARIAGVKPQDFLAAANSFTVDSRIRAADEQVAAMKVPGTPSLVVNGKYRLNMESLHGGEEVVELVRFLVSKDGK